MAKKLLAASGYSPEKPVKFKIQTTRGFKPKDYEMIQAIVGMWRKVGIEADIEVYEIAKHYELRAGAQARADGLLQLGRRDRRSRRPRPASRCSRPRRIRPGRSNDLDAKIGPLWGEKDEAKRIAGWKAVDKYIAEKGYVIPLVQYVAADRLQVGPQGHAERVRRAAADAGRQGLIERWQRARSAARRAA